MGGLTLVAMCFFELIMVSYCYGWRQFVKDIKLMMGEPPNKFWKYLGYPVNYYWIANWLAISPALLLVMTMGDKF